MATSSTLAQAMRALDSRNALMRAPSDRIALGLLDFFRRDPDESVSRRNTINRMTQELGAGGKERRAAARVIAEGWQHLANLGVICPDPEQPQGESWFLTRRGAELVARGPEEALEALRQAPWR